jgi:glycogen synthase
VPLRFGDGKGGVPSGLDYNFQNVKFYTIASTLKPYDRPEQFTDMSQHARQQSFEKAKHLAEIYGSDMYSAINMYAKEAVKISQLEDFDIIHAHDWMTFPAGIAVARATGKPLVVQIHSTEFDRSGEHVNQMVYDIERHGMYAANVVITVSNYTRNIVLDRYSVPSEKVEVVYNGVEYDQCLNCPEQALPSKHDKIVLFLGRITMQKGPEYFLYAAKRVLEKIENVKFIMAGTGDMLHGSIELAANLGIGHKVLFTRFLRGSDVDKAYKMADLYVMPSVSEPFGITPLEAMRNNVPVLISKQSGISEVVQNVLKVDFWDIDQMANKIIAVLKHPPLQTALVENSAKEIYKFRWEDSAARMNEIYQRTLKKIKVLS